VNREQEMEDIKRNKMGEAAPLIICDHIFNGSAMFDLHEDKVRTMRLLVQYKEEIRYLYLKAACDGVGDPSKAFKMTKTQFSNMCEKLGHTQGFPNEENQKFYSESCGKIFVRANEDLTLKHNEILTGATKEGGNVASVEFVQQLDRYIDQMELSCIICRIAENRYMDVLKDQHPKCKGIFVAVGLYCENLIKPWVDTSKAKDEQEMEFKSSIMEKIAAPQMKKFATKIKKIYAKVSATGITGADGAANQKSTMDCTEFLSFCKNVNICDGGFSMSQALDVYLYTNMDEIETYLKQIEPMGDINAAMVMTIDEFVEAILLIGAYKLNLPTKKVSDITDKKLIEATKKFDVLLEDMVTAGMQL